MSTVSVAEIVRVCEFGGKRFARLQFHHSLYDPEEIADHPVNVVSIRTRSQMFPVGPWAGEVPESLGEGARVPVKLVYAGYWQPLSEIDFPAEVKAGDILSCRMTGRFFVVLGVSEDRVTYARTECRGEHRESLYLDVVRWFHVFR